MMEKKESTNRIIQKLNRKTGKALILVMIHSDVTLLADVFENFLSLFKNTIKLIEYTLHLYTVNLKKLAQKSHKTRTRKHSRSSFFPLFEKTVGCGRFESMAKRYVVFVNDIKLFATDSSKLYVFAYSQPLPYANRKVTKICEYINNLKTAKLNYYYPTKNL